MKADNIIKFGTSGFRGIMGDTFTKSTVQKIGYALTQIIRQSHKEAKIAIGFDNRFMSKKYAEWITEVLAIDAKVLFYKVSVPSGLICWKTKVFDYGIVITASHNPYLYNGIKIFTHGGKDCDDEFANNIEYFANSITYNKIKSMPFKQLLEMQRIELTSNYHEYCDSMLKLIKLNNKRRKLKILINVMHGNATTCTKYCLKKLGYKTFKIINSTINPYFSDMLPAPYPQNLTDQIEMLKTQKYELGVAFDGDSDRIAILGKKGEYYDCNQLGAVIFENEVVNQEKKTGIVKTVAVSTLFDKIARSAHVPIIETKVGQKYIGKELEITTANIGVEPSGIDFKEHILSKDGIFAFLKLIEAISHFSNSFDQKYLELQEKYDFKCYQLEHAYPLSSEKFDKIKELLLKQENLPSLPNMKIKKINTKEGLKIIYTNDYWVLCRPSGNEPVMRIYAEMSNKDNCETAIKEYEKYLNLTERQ